jgi:hypothetical protein
MGNAEKAVSFEISSWLSMASKVGIFKYALENKCLKCA